MSRCKRKTIVAHPKVQYRLLLHEWLHFTVIILSLAMALFLPLVLRLQSSETGWMEQMNLGRTLLFLHAHLWPVLLSVFVLLSLHSLVLSNKLVGPIPRFLAEIRAFAGGMAWSAPRPRKGDFLFEDLKELSDVLADLQENLLRVHREHADLQRVVERMARSLELEKNRPPGPVDADFLQLRQQCSSLEKAIRDLNRDDGSERRKRQNANDVPVAAMTFPDPSKPEKDTS